MSTVSNNIKYLRRLNGLTQEQFARKIGIKRSLLGAYEEGRANPNLDNLMNIAKIFGTSVDNLLQNDLRRLRETRGVPLPQPSHQLLLREDVEPPKPLSAFINQYHPSVETPPAPVKRQPPLVRVVPQRMAFKPVNGRSRVVPVAPALKRPEPVIAPTNGTAVAPVNPLKQEIEWVSQQAAPEYLTSYAYPDYIKQLPSFQLPMLPAGKYRAFEMGTDFVQPGSTVVGQFVNNWYDIRDGQPYVLAVYKQGILYRRVYNQVKIKGTLLLSSDDPRFPSYEVSIKEVLEIWQAKAFISLQMPQATTSVPTERLQEIVKALNQEVQNLAQGGRNGKPAR